MFSEKKLYYWGTKLVMKRQFRIWNPLTRWRARHILSKQWELIKNVYNSNERENAVKSTVQLVAIYRGLYVPLDRETKDMFSTKIAKRGHQPKKGQDTTVINGATIRHVTQENLKLKSADIASTSEAIPATLVLVPEKEQVKQVKKKGKNKEKVGSSVGFDNKGFLYPDLNHVMKIKENGNLTKDKPNRKVTHLEKEASRGELRIQLMVPKVGKEPTAPPENIEMKVASACKCTDTPSPNSGTSSQPEKAQYPPNPPPPYHGPHEIIEPPTPVESMTHFPPYQSLSEKFLGL